MKRHRTYHGSEADAQGFVWLGCEACYWRAQVDVSGRTWAEVMERIYAARDAHEADPFADVDMPPRGVEA